MFELLKELLSQQKTKNLNKTRWAIQLCAGRTTNFHHLRTASRSCTIILSTPLLLFLFLDNASQFGYTAVGGFLFACDKSFFYEMVVQWMAGPFITWAERNMGRLRTTRSFFPARRRVQPIRLCERSHEDERYGLETTTIISQIKHRRVDCNPGLIFSSQSKIMQCSRCFVPLEIVLYYFLSYLIY